MTPAAPDPLSGAVVSTVVVVVVLFLLWRRRQGDVEGSQ